jgi:hypothetical protein
MLGSFGPRESTTHRSQRCVGGDQGRVCRPKRSLLLGLHLTEKTDRIFGVMVCAVRLHVLASYVDCKGVGKMVVDGSGRETCHVYRPLGKVKTCDLGGLGSC